MKSAAIHHLDFHLFLLEKNATLIDASAYNIQFIGSQPIFIDLLSIKKYENGEYWNGHKQFCENFLNPLIFKIKKKRLILTIGSKEAMEGIYTHELNNMLSFFDKFSFNIFVQVYLLNKLEEKAKSKKNLTINKNKKPFRKKFYLNAQTIKKIYN